MQLQGIGEPLFTAHGAVPIERKERMLLPFQRILFPLRKPYVRRPYCSLSSSCAWDSRGRVSYFSIHAPRGPYRRMGVLARPEERNMGSWLIKTHTTVTVVWIAEGLARGHCSNASRAFR